MLSDSSYKHLGVGAAVIGSLALGVLFWASRRRYLEEDMPIERNKSFEDLPTVEDNTLHSLTLDQLVTELREGTIDQQVLNMEVSSAWNTLQASTKTLRKPRGVVVTKEARVPISFSELLCLPESLSEKSEAVRTLLEGLAKSNMQINFVSSEPQSFCSCFSSGSNCSLKKEYSRSLLGFGSQLCLSVSLGVSSAGIGLDLLGQLRMAALQSGMFCLVSPQRLPVIFPPFVLNRNRNHPFLINSVGLVAKTLEDALFVTKMVLNDQLTAEYTPFDQSKPKRLIGWTEDLLSLQPPLTVGIIAIDDEHPLESANVRAMAWAETALKNAKFNVVPFVFPALTQLWKVFLRYYALEVVNDRKNEKDRKKTFNSYLSFCSILPHSEPHSDSGFFADNLKDIPAEKFYEICYEHKQIAQQFAEEIGRQNIDLLLVPGCPASLRQRHWKFFLFESFYVSISAMLELPCLAVPVTKVFPNEESVEVRNLKDSLKARFLGEHARMSRGLPVGVQLLCRPYKEETLFKAAEAIQAESQRIRLHLS